MPHAIAVTTADVTDRGGALAAIGRCKPNLDSVESLLVDGGCTGQPFADSVGKRIEATVQVVKLGAHTLTLASLLFTSIKNAIFARSRRTLYSLFADEAQNLVSYSNDIETVLAEARKFGVSMVLANQFLDQYPPPMRAAMLSTGSQVYFQISSADAATIAQSLDGGRPLAERLKNLPQRHFLLKSAADRVVEGCVPNVEEPKANFRDLVNRVRALRARPRGEIEREIEVRHAQLTRTTDEVLHGWN